MLWCETVLQCIHDLIWLSWCLCHSAVFACYNTVTRIQVYLKSRNCKLCLLEFTFNQLAMLLPAGLDGHWLSLLESHRIYRPISPLKCEVSAIGSVLQVDSLQLANHLKTLNSLIEKWSSHKGQTQDQCSYIMKPSEERPANTRSICDSITQKIPCRVKC